MYQLMDGYFFDYVSVVFWTIAYIFSFLFSVKYKTFGFPAMSLIFNFSWELNAAVENILIKNFSDGNFAWLFSDMLLLYAFYKYQIRRDKEQRKKWTLILILNIVLFFIIFQLPNGKLYSSFVIDIFMAVAFLYIGIKRFDKGQNWVVAFMKLIGDLGAWFHYMNISPVIFFIGLGSFLCNTAYLILVIKKTPQANKDYLEKQALLKKEQRRIKLKQKKTRKRRK